MLQQILREMYVDPEILAELDEDYKQKLFCKMREEQVRRWKLWNEKLDEKKTTITKNNKKKVEFKIGEDGEPWVWVMGEHKNDKTIDEILREETLEKARKLAEIEVEAELSQFLTPKIVDFQTPTSKFVIEDDTDIYCSVDELREKINLKKPTTTPTITTKTTNILSNYSINNYKDKNKYNLFDTQVFQDLSLNTTQKVASKVALWEKRLTDERTCEILQNMQKKRQEISAQAAEDEEIQEQAWREQERKAKEAEQQIREIARRAREEHRLSSNLEIDTTYSTVNQGVPPGKQAVLEWFRKIDKTKSGVCDKNGNPQAWFHGLITRGEAEKLLLDQPYGSFLVRLSEKIWGYAISYRAKEKCKHYLINAINNNYSFTGNNQLEHNTLSNLVNYHKINPLSGGETLNFSCPRICDDAIKEFLD